jgi:hypothetical protein
VVVRAGAMRTTWAGQVRMAMRPAERRDADVVSRRSMAMRRVSARCVRVVVALWCLAEAAAAGGLRSQAREFWSPGKRPRRANGDAQRAATHETTTTRQQGDEEDPPPLSAIRSLPSRSPPSRPTASRPNRQQLPSSLAGLPASRAPPWSACSWSCSWHYACQDYTYSYSWCGRCYPRSDTRSVQTAVQIGTESDRKEVVSVEFRSQTGARPPSPAESLPPLLRGSNLRQPHPLAIEFDIANPRPRNETGIGGTDQP